jgi:hypothetical protein
MTKFLYLGCTVGDVLLTVLIYMLVGWTVKDTTWLKQFRMREIRLSLSFSILLAVLTELVAISLGLWAYSEKMPLIPLAGIGLSPFLQITLLPLLAFYITHKYNRNYQR